MRNKCGKVWGLQVPKVGMMGRPKLVAAMAQVGGMVAGHGWLMSMGMGVGMGIHVYGEQA